MTQIISKDDFAKIEIKIGEIISAEKVPNTDKLLKLSVDFGLKLPTDSMTESSQSVSEIKDIRQVVSGIAKYFPEPTVLVGKKCPFITNLEPRIIKGLESQAMIMAASGYVGLESERFSLLEVSKNILAGDVVL